MPSPIGHGLAALAAGWGSAGIAGERQRLVRQAAILVAIGVVPDLDLFVGRHSMETHSLGAAVLVATLAAWRRWPVAASRARIWLAVAAAWMSHPLLDALGSDTSPPIGVMAFWPFSTAHVQTSWHVFGAISRRYWRDDFWSLNLASIGHELVILIPILTLVVLARMWAMKKRAMTEMAK